MPRRRSDSVSTLLQTPSPLNPGVPAQFGAPPAYDAAPPKEEIEANGGPGEAHLAPPLSRSHEVRRPAAPHVVTPHLNRLYDGLRTPAAWRYVAELQGAGSITPIAGQMVTAAVTPDHPPLMQLDRYPKAPMAFIVVRFFGVAPSAATMTGAYSCVYLDPGGNTIPLGEFMATGGGNVNILAVSPTPITDPSNVSWGSVGIQLQAGGAGPVAVYWRLGLGLAYLMPANLGYTYQGQAWPQPNLRPFDGLLNDLLAREGGE